MFSSVSSTDYYQAGISISTTLPLSHQCGAAAQNLGSKSRFEETIQLNYRDSYLVHKFCEQDACGRVGWVRRTCDCSYLK